MDGSISEIKLDSDYIVGSDYIRNKTVSVNGKSRINSIISQISNYKDIKYICWYCIYQHNWPGYKYIDVHNLSVMKVSDGFLNKIKLKVVQKINTIIEIVTHFFIKIREMLSKFLFNFHFSFINLITRKPKEKLIRVIKIPSP